MTGASEEPLQESGLAGVRRDTGEPPTLQAYRSLADMIKRGTLPPGRRLPSERELAKGLGISRATLRHALKALEDDGLLSATHGSGWYVTDWVVGEPSSDLMSFTEMAKARGVEPTAQVLSSSVSTASMDEADQLQIAPGAPVFHLERLRLLDDIPIAVVSSRLPLQRVPGLEDRDFTTTSLYHALESGWGLSARACDYVVQATPADDRQSSLLEVPPGTPMLTGWWRTFDQHNRPLEIGRISYRGERYRFETRLVRRRGQPYLGSNPDGALGDG